MRIYDNETKIYPDLNPTTPQEPQTYWLNKLSEIEAFFLNEIEKSEQKTKKVKRSITILSITDKSLITSTKLNGGVSIAALASGVGLPVGIVQGGTSLLFFPYPPHKNTKNMIPLSYLPKVSKIA